MTMCSASGVNDVIAGQSVAAVGLHDAQIHTDRHREVRHRQLGANFNISKLALHFRCFRYNRFWGGQNHLVYIGDSRVRQLYTAARGQ